MGMVFAKRMEKIKASEIREILKVTEKPDVISFAGGLPAPELFPVDEMKKIAVRVLDKEGMQALQYATTEGFLPLREKIADRMNKVFKTDVSGDDILITSGSQQGLDLTGKIFLNEDDAILCESPTYLGAINAFQAYGPRFVEIPTDDAGMIMEKLEETLKNNKNVKFIYIISDFQNPTGRTWSLKRRMELIELINHYDIPVIEDNPYGELRFSGDMLPSLKSMDQKGRVIYLGTFSKVFCPGFRIGWIAADKKILEKYILVKQGADLHTSSIGQREISKYMELYNLDDSIKNIKNVYKKRCDTMISAMEREFPNQVVFTRPEGGLFTWVELPDFINARDILVSCLKENVAFVPGGSFFPNGGHENTFRLNYSNMPEDRIIEGIKRIGKVLTNSMITKNE